MSTFIGQLIGFAVIVFLVVRFVVPPVRNMMRLQQDTVRQQLEASSAAAEKVARADEEHAKAVAAAKEEAARVVEEARADAEKIAEQMREQADADVERIKVQGEAQRELLRQQLIRELRQELGTESVHRARELVREHVSDDGNRSATVDRFLDELDAMAPSEANVGDSVGARMRATSREALEVVVSRFDEHTAQTSAEELTTLADDLVSVAKLLGSQPVLSKHLGEPTDGGDAKSGLAERLLSGKISDTALALVKTAVEQRWSDEADLIFAIRYMARLSLLVRAERNDESDEVEEQLFRFSRILDGESQLSALLSDYTTPLDGRIGLLDKLLENKANNTTRALLAQTVSLLHGERADEAVRELAELAVSRRGEVVAHVSAAAELSDDQRTRLTEVLSRIYSHPVSVQLHIDPSMLGGLTVAVGDEVIEGSLSSRLAAAETRLPD
ncbi:F0F1 ATP synthase subunit B/delta [Mycolicibacterium duvalii]|uniref:Multifunctional fusion protein n=1 Tax=Mycolicibacterium duvalii TaxID=39688 RepID=A0A7I7JUD5_9MYCO|nr:F0F1 ATP synthase subunit B/delta [Mycolicibacterium duvalii]MCV7369293.1 F0F1 ATP synthase subunit B/delta [Mycolicibacterium duvalii]PEG35394.1 F0F1 ATP synthase subunit B/delta [Mycolicibacterium duvalii]BBX15477.1 ATP synthase subunit b-delta [Mycolicibacterium duvalii]